MPFGGQVWDGQLWVPHTSELPALIILFFFVRVWPLISSKCCLHYFVSVQDLYALEQLQSTRPNFFPLSFIDCFVSQHDILNQYGFPFAIAPYKWRPSFPCTIWNLRLSWRSRSSTSRTSLHLIQEGGDDQEVLDLSTQMANEGLAFFSITKKTGWSFL